MLIISNEDSHITPDYTIVQLWYDITMLNTTSTQAKALFYTILLAALSHLIITLFVTLINQQPDLANMFNVLGVSLLFPELGKGPVNAALGVLTVSAMWAIIFSVMQLHKRKKSNISQS